MNNLLLHFEVAIAPIGKGRHRAFKLPNGQIRTYTPTKTQNWEATFQAMTAQYLPDTPLEGPLRVDILAVLPRPKRLMRQKDPDGLLWAPVRPDVDNIRKGVLDAMDLFWGDDKQVVAGQTLKVYCEKSGRPRVEVWIGRPGIPHHVIGVMESAMKSSRPILPGCFEMGQGNLAV